MIVNRVADAREMFRLLRERSRHPVRHLSTRMCSVHRSVVLADVRARLAARDPILLVSTQLIEAGVDVDFPVVFRAIAPADSLQQAAGRANREGTMHGAGRVVVFEAEEWQTPAFYKTAVAHTRALFGPDKPPEEPEALTDYFIRFYNSVPPDGRRRAAAVKKARERLDFHAVADGPEPGDDRGGRDRSLAFRMIDDLTVPVVVPVNQVFRASLGSDVHGDVDVTQLSDLVDVLELLQRIRAGDADRRTFRRLQPYTVALPIDVTRGSHVAASLLRPVVGDLLEWVGPYDTDLGLDEGNPFPETIW